MCAKERKKTCDQYVFLLQCSPEQKKSKKKKKQCRTPYQIQFGLPNMHSFHVVEHWVEFARMPKEKKCDETYFFFLVS